MKRQRGRHNGRKPHQPHNPNLPIRAQTFDSSGPDVRIRGNAYQVLEKYLALARDAQSAGDRVAAESYFQHAEHYFRLLNDNGGFARPQHQQFQQQGPQQGQLQQQGGQGQQGGYQGHQQQQHQQGGYQAGNYQSGQYQAGQYQAGNYQGPSHQALQQHGGHAQSGYDQRYNQGPNMGHGQEASPAGTGPQPAVVIPHHGATGTFVPPSSGNNGNGNGS